MKNKKALIVAAGLALFAIVIANNYIEKRISEVVGPYEKLQVVVAEKDIEINDRVETSMLSVIDVPKKFVQPGALSSIKKAVGQVAVTSIAKGEQILENKLWDTSSKFLALRIPPGKRAVSLAVNNITGVAGHVRPGNKVDVVAIYDYTKTQVQEGRSATQKILDVRARTILQDVKVLASGKDFAFVSNPLSNKSEKGSGNATSVTLALTPRQAQQVILAQRISILSLMLRRHGEEEGEVEIPQDNVFSITGNQEVMFDKETPKFLEIRGGASSLTY